MAALGGGNMTILGGKKILQLNDTDGVDTFQLKDSDGFTIFKVDSKGEVYTRRGIQRL